MEACPTCERIIPDSAMVCEHCGVSAAPELEAPAAVAAAPLQSRGVGRRDVMMIAVAVIGSGVITLAALSARGSVIPPEVSAGEPAPAPVSSEPSVPDPAAPGAAGWIENRALWTGNERRSVAFERPARNETAVWMKKVRPTLVVRCLANRMDVFVFTDSAAAMETEDADHTVRLRFDDKAELTERWPDSVDHDALFAPDGAALAQQLMRAQTLRFGYTPHNAAPVVAEFDVRGLAGRIAPQAAHCGRK